MSLVTRCPACGTVFRVVQDQLKVSEGWVRCGRCSEVFNAVDGLFDLDHEEGTTVALAEEGTVPFAADESLTLEEASPLRVDALMDAVTQAKPTVPPSDDAVDDDASTAAAAEELNAVYARLAPDAVRDDGPAAPLADVLPDSQPDTQADTSTETTPWLEPPDDSNAVEEGSATHTPDFVRRADQAERWRHPAMRSALALLSLLLAAALVAQVALHYRDGLAASWPTSRPWLQQACELAGCRIDAPRRIDAISVDSSGLLRADDGDSGLYRLTLVLNNRSAAEVRMPAIDLALTDSLGQTSIRRVLYAADLGQPATTLAANSELAMQGLLDLGELRVVGYTVELFYP